METLQPLEGFLRHYLETVGGDWDEIEPQVYDLILPGAAAESTSGGVLRVTFDPEALPEHPAAQLATLGTPFIDGILHEALEHGRRGTLYLIGLNLSPHDLPGRLRRTLTLPDNLALHLRQVRAMHFGQAVFWFQAEFISDQREQETVPVGMDMHYGREVRHLEPLLDRSRLADQPAQPLPEARRASAAAILPAAREQVLRTVAALANVRGRELAQRRDVHIARMAQYYTDLRAELEGTGRRGGDAEEATRRLATRRQALDREEQLRIAELRQKSSLQVQLRLLQWLLIQQPKLLLRTELTDKERTVGQLELVWDLLGDALEAVPCTNCRRPTFAFEQGPQGRVGCANCADKSSSQPNKASRMKR